MNGLGTLEARVMDVLWGTSEALTVRDILERLSDPYAYTTILTVLTHLHEKEWVVRVMHRRAYLYRPARSRAEATAEVVRGIIDSSNDPESVLLHLASIVTEAESEAFHRGRARPAERSKK